MSVNGGTNVYTVRHPEGCEYILPRDPNDYGLLIFDGRSRARSWNPISVCRLKVIDGKFRQPCDFPSPSTSSYLIMTETAKKKIGAQLERYGEFLPLKCDEGTFWAFHVTHLVDALDEAASDVLRASDDPNHILMIHRHVFRPEKLTGDWMFKLPQSHGRGSFYVTDPFVNLIGTSGLTGLSFKRVWPQP